MLPSDASVPMEATPVPKIVIGDVAEGGFTVTVAEENAVLSARLVAFSVTTVCAATVDGDK